MPGWPKGGGGGRWTGGWGLLVTADLISCTVHISLNFHIAFWWRAIQSCSLSLSLCLSLSFALPIRCNPSIFPSYLPNRLLTTCNTNENNKPLPESRLNPVHHLRTGGSHRTGFMDVIVSHWASAGPSSHPLHPPSPPPPSTLPFHPPGPYQSIGRVRQRGRCGCPSPASHSGISAEDSADCRWEIGCGSGADWVTQL